MNGGAGEGGRTASLPAVVPAAVAGVVHLPKIGDPLSYPRAMLGSVETRSVSPVFVGRTGELATLNIAEAEGRLPDARAELLRVLEAGFPPGTQRYGWPLLLSAAAAEADARALPAAEEGRADILDRLAEAAKHLTTGAPVWAAHERWVRAELHRAHGRDTPQLWSEVVTAFECLERPYDLARVRHRLAGALLATGGEDERARATELLRLARTVADHLGARPLSDAVALLGRRARLTLGHAGEPAAPPEPTDPAEALGLTGRERDVLRWSPRAAPTAR